jgi:hypothetical protein
MTIFQKEKDAGKPRKLTTAVDFPVVKFKIDIPKGRGAGSNCVIERVSLGSRSRAEQEERLSLMVPVRSLSSSYISRLKCIHGIMAISLWQSHCVGVGTLQAF